MGVSSGACSVRMEVPVIDLAQRLAAAVCAEAERRGIDLLRLPANVCTPAAIARHLIGQHPLPEDSETGRAAYARDAIDAWQRTQQENAARGACHRSTQAADRDLTEEGQQL